MLLVGQGTFEFGGAGDTANVIDNLAANIDGNLNLLNSVNLAIGDLTLISNCGNVNVAVFDIDANGPLNGDFNLQLENANLTQSIGATVEGLTTVDAGTGIICMTDPTNDFGGLVTASADVVEFVDANDMTVGVISAVDDIFLRAGADPVATGLLTLTNNLTTTALAGQTLLQADAGVLQSGGIITTAELLLGGDDAEEGAGDFDLLQSNVVGTLAADIDGSLDFVNDGTIVVDSLSYASACGTAEAIVGLNVDTKIRLRAEGVGGITLNQAVTVNAVNGTVFLESTDGATQLAAGTITGANLMMRGTGTFDLNDAANDVDNLAAEINGQLDYFDNDEVTIATLDCDGITVCGINTVGDLNLTTNDGNLFQDADAAVIVGGNTVLTTGTGDICLTGGDCTGDGVNDNLFTGTLTISNTGDVVIAENDDLNIDSVTSTGSLRFIGNNIQINTAITADQLLLEASDGVDYNNNVIDVTDLLLIGQGTFEFGGAGDTANVIDNLAANIDGNLNLLNSVNMDIGDLTLISNCGNVNVCGVNIDANGLLNGDFNLQLEDVNLTQSAGIAVEGLTTIAAGTGDICLTGASCTLGVANENDLTTLFIQSADDASVVDSNDLVVNEATTASQLHLVAGSEGTGNLTIAGNLTAAEQVLLQSAGDTTQTGGIIATADLLLGSETNTDADGGNFTLTNANTVSRLSAFVAGSLNFVNNGSLEISELTFADDCGINETICGVRSGIDLLLNVTGDLTQTAAVRVGGDADLTATGIICLTGADCLSLPGIGNDNDFTGTVTASATTVEIVDINDLTVGDISATDDIRLVAGDGDGDGNVSGTIDGAEILQSGLLQINGDLTVTAADGQVLLESDGGMQQDALSTITANDLLVLSDLEATSLSGDFSLTGTNQVNRIAGDIGLDGQTFSDAQLADLFGDVGLTFNNTIDLEIADLSYASACGTAVASCGLTVDGNLTLNVGPGAASITQTAPLRVTGDADINATSLVCLTGGDCATLPGVGNDNDIVGVLSGTGEAFEFFDINDLIAGDITASDDIRLVAGDGDGDSNLNNVIDGAEVLQSGSLTLQGTLETTNANGQVLLQADNGATQNLASVIRTDQLILLARHEATSLIADFNLVGDNEVNQLAADLGFDGQTLADAVAADNFGDVSLTFTNTVDLVVADLDYVSACSNESVCGWNIDGDLTLNLTGDLTQTASVRVTGDSDFTVSGILCLTGADCATLPGVGNDNDFVGTVNASATTIELVDINTLTVGTLTADADVRLVAGDGDGDSNLNNVIDGAEFLQSGTLELNGNITTNAGQVLLQTDGGIQQAAGFGITANDLLVQTIHETTSIGGDVDLTGVNDVARVAVEIGLDGQTFQDAQLIDPLGNTNLNLNNISDLELADLTYASACGTNVAVCGFDVDGQLILTVTGDLTQTAPIRIAETSNLTASGIICLTGASCDPAFANQNDFVGEVTASGATVELVDINDLTVGVITATDDIRLEAGNGNGDLNANDVIDGTEVAQTGLLQLSGNLTTTAADGQVLLQSDGGIQQAVATGIQTNDLLVQTLHESTSNGGDVNLAGTNQVNRLAADIAMDGQTLADAANALTDNFGDADFTFNNSVALELANLNYASACGTAVAICGVSIDGNLNLTNTLDLTQTGAIRVTGDSIITSTATVCLNGADCPTLPGIGNDNDFVGEVVATGTTVELVDINDLLVGDITSVDDIFLRAGDGETGSLTLNGNLQTTAGQVLLQADTAITQAVASVITATDLLVGSESDADARAAQATLNGVNLVDRLSVRLDNNFVMTNGIDLDIAELTYDSICGTNETICGVDIRGGNLELLLNNSTLTQTAAVTVTGTSLLRATGLGDICLTGGECSDLPTIGNDNDFGGLVTAEGRTVELVDINDLNVASIIATNDIRLESGSFAGATQTGAINLSGDLTTAGGQVLLQSDGGITQNATAVITATDLLVQSTTDVDSVVADFNLLGNNEVDHLAANVDVSLSIENRRNLEIASLNYVSTCGTNEAIAGLTVGQNWTAYVNGTLTQSATAVVTGTSTLAASDNIILFDPTNDFGGNINANRAADLTTGDLAAAGNFVELQDANAMAVEDAFANRGVRLVTNDAMTLNGNITADQVLLQSNNGATQAVGAQINATQLMVGGNLASEGNGKFVLDANNNVRQLAAELQTGTLQFRNSGDLTIVALAQHTGSNLVTAETIMGIQVNESAIADEVLAGTFDNPNVRLQNTIQGTAGNVGQRFNPNADFTNFLDTNDVGLAIHNAGNLTTAVGAGITATETGILLETSANGGMSVNSTVRVTNAVDRIAAIAGGDLAVNAGGRFERGGSGLVFNDELVNLILKNPGVDSNTNAQVDANLYNQKLEFLTGDLFEQFFHTTVFWGIAGPEDDTFDLASLNQTELTALTDLLFDGGTNFESRSFYGPNQNAADFNGTGGADVEVTSLPIGNTFDTGGKTNDTPAATASFTLNFLRINSEFRNVQVMFNDAGINLFENADTALVDLNVATADFQGLARIGATPVIFTERTDFTVPERVEITRPEEVFFFESTVIDEPLPLIQKVSESFVVVVYFESQYEADLFESRFEKLSGSNETGEIDFEEVRKLLEQNGLDSLEWNADNAESVADVNQIREILERAGLDLGEENEQSWTERYRQWLQTADDPTDSPEIPRGVYKIIEVDEGKAVIRGDDVDRRFVPEPSNDDQLKDYPFQREPEDTTPEPENDDQSYHFQDIPQRHEILPSAAPEGDTPLNGVAATATAASTLSALATMVKRNNAKKKSTSVAEEYRDGLRAEKARNPGRNIFSRAARFLRNAGARLAGRNDDHDSHDAA